MRISSHRKRSATSVTNSTSHISPSSTFDITEMSQMTPSPIPLREPINIINSSLPSLDTATNMTSTDTGDSQQDYQQEVVVEGDTGGYLYRVNATIEEAHSKITQLSTSLYQSCEDTIIDITMIHEELDNIYNHLINKADQLETEIMFLQGNYINGDGGGGDGDGDGDGGMDVLVSTALNGNDNTNTTNGNRNGGGGNDDDDDEESKM